MRWREFAGFIRDVGLIDIPCKRKRFSWFSGDGKCKSRLAIFLVSNSLMVSWGVIGKFVGQRYISNHFSFSLIVDNEDWGPKPFRFNNEWLKNKYFLLLREKEWNALVVHSRGDFVLKQKLSLFKTKLKWWNIIFFEKLDLEVEEGGKGDERG